MSKGSAEIIKRMCCVFLQNNVSCALAMHENCIWRQFSQFYHLDTASSNEQMNKHAKAMFLQLCYLFSVATVKVDSLFSFLKGLEVLNLK